MNRRKKNKPKAARRKSVTPANSPSAGPRSTGDRIDNPICLEARTNIDDEVEAISKALSSEFEEKLHEAGKESGLNRTGSLIEAVVEAAKTVEAVKTRVNSLSRNVTGHPVSTLGKSINTREAFVIPILKKKGLSIHGWASTANVDFHTADNYLKGKSKPYRDTLKKLADSLGVEVANLPQ